MKTVKLLILFSLVLLLGNTSLLAKVEMSRLDKIAMQSQHYNGSIKSLPIPLNLEVYLCDDNSILLDALEGQNGALEVTVVNENGSVAYRGIVNVQANSSVVLPLQNISAGSYTILITDYKVEMKGEFIIQENIE